MCGSPPRPHTRFGAAACVAGGPAPSRCARERAAPVAVGGVGGGLGRGWRRRHGPKRWPAGWQKEPMRTATECLVLGRAAHPEALPGQPAADTVPAVSLCRYHDGSRCCHHRHDRLPGRCPRRALPCRLRPSRALRDRSATFGDGVGNWRCAPTHKRNGSGGSGSRGRPGRLFRRRAPPSGPAVGVRRVRAWSSPSPPRTPSPKRIKRARRGVPHPAIPCPGAPRQVPSPAKHPPSRPSGGSGGGGGASPCTHSNHLQELLSFHRSARRSSSYDTRATRHRPPCTPPTATHTSPSTLLHANP